MIKWIMFSWWKRIKMRWNVNQTFEKDENGPHRWWTHTIYWIINFVWKSLWLTVTIEEQMQIKSVPVLDTSLFVCLFRCFQRWERTYGRGGMKRDGIWCLANMDRNTFMHPPWQVQKYIYTSMANTKSNKNVQMTQVSQMIFSNENGGHLMSLVICSFSH